ncbi:RNA-binding protein, partial [Candidatus Woesearchaeota archaeon]|nr:RNA-binding protein [Candidatus Woesearchaeota archaeon]
IELARVIDRGIRESESIDVKKLCIEAGEKVWSVGVDLITINNDGNLMDCAGIAAMAAIKDAVLPKLDEEGNVSYKEHSKDKLPIEKDPVSVTVHMIGDQIVVDPSVAEEKASDARITVASSDENIIAAMQKGGSKALTIDEVDEMINLAIDKAMEIRKSL